MFLCDFRMFLARCTIGFSSRSKILSDTDFMFLTFIDLILVQNNKCLCDFRTSIDARSKSTAGVDAFSQ